VPATTNEPSAHRIESDDATASSRPKSARTSPPPNVESIDDP
jgi:hypothetical protein